jgi:RHS repeat-associated protein
MNNHLRLAAIALVLAAAQPVFSQTFNDTDTATQPNNSDPKDCCECITIEIGDQSQPNSPGKNGPSIPAETNGDYKVKLKVEVTDSTDCEEVEITNIKLVPEGGVGDASTVEVTPISNPKLYEGTVTISGSKVESSGTTKWKVVVTCSGEANGTPTTSSSATIPCESPFTLGEGCKSCESGTCPGDADNGCFSYDIPVGASNGGDTTGTIRFFTPDFNNPGRSGVAAFVPSSFTVNRTAGIITSVVTPTNTIELTSAATAFDPNAFSIVHKHTASGTVFRTTTIGRVQDGGVTYIRADSTFDGNTFRFQQSQPAAGTFLLESGPVVGSTFTALRKESLTITVPLLGTEIHRETTQEIDPVTNTFVTVSDTATTWNRFAWGWEMTQQAIDPTGANLVSNWTYYQPGEHTGPNASTEGLGKVHTHTRYDGHQEVHTYWLNNHQTQLPYESAAQALTLSRQYNPSSGTTTATKTVGGNTLSKEEKTYDPATNITTTTVHNAANTSLSTITKLMPFNADFGGQTASVIHPDGTLTTYTYTRHSDGGKTIVMQNGVASGNTVSLGTSTTTTTNRYGTVIRTITETIGYPTNIVTNHSAVTSVDAFGRPLVTAAFPTASSAADGAVQASATGAAWTTTSEYSCCGVAKETDMYGTPSYNAYDTLRRPIKTNRLGVTTETVRKGLITETHRYPETVSTFLSSNLVGTPSTLVSKSVTNLAGTLQESWSPDPTSTTAGALIKDSSTATTYKPAAGLSTRSITTVPGGHSQTTDSFLDGRTAKTSGDLSPAMTYSYSVNAEGEISSQSYLDGSDLRETTTTQADWAGRTKRVTYMDNSFAEMDYNELGQLEKSSDPDGVTTLFLYKPEGERTVTAIDLNLNGEIDYGSDTVSFSETEPVAGTSSPSSSPGFLTISKVWQDGDSNPAAGTLVSTSFRRSDGLYSSSQSIGIANPSTSLTVLNGNGSWTTTSTAPDGTRTVTTYTGGLMDITENFASNNAFISSTSMRDSSNVSLSGYDSLKRPTHQRDSRTGVTTTAYLSTTADVVKSITDSGNRTTGFTYDARGRRTHVDAPDSLDASGAPLTNITQTFYFPDGNVQETTGGQTYRTTHTYDYADRQKTLTTYGSTTATTTWIYSPDRGFLERKEYHDGKGTDYTYTDAGRLETRTWERGVLTTYDYDDGGRLETVTYSNETNGHTTPNLVNTYDALGRLKTVTRGGVPHAEYTYRPGDLQRLAETQQIDTLNQTVTYTYEDGTNGTLGGRPNGYTSTHASAIWTYDQAGRLETVSNGTDTFTYGYRYTLNSGLHEGVITPGQGTESAMPFTLDGPKVDTTLAYETSRNALAFRRNDLTGGTLSKFAYGLNDLGQRVALTPTGSAFATTTPFSWGYNGRGELTTATRSGNTPFERAYSYDGIGNRLTATDDNAALTNYFADAVGNNAGGNTLNQYGKITYPGSSSLQPVHDDDGNMTSGPVPGATGLLPGVPVPANATLTWDAENRLVKAVVNGTTVHYDYDHQSRLISRGVGVTPTTFTRYLYDGWNRIAEYESNGTGHTLKSTYLWGMDLSGTMQGAGGVGGLLSMTLNSQPSPLNYYPTYDGNGNVSEYVDDNGDKAAHFEYDPFGNLTVDSENNAGDFSYRFSTKPQDATTGLYYYGYRWYDPLTGRWPSRDPLEEEGGINLYVFVANSGINNWDYLGQAIETGWDLFNVGLGFVEFGVCVASGDTVGAAIALGGVTVDLAATVIPGVPGGASTLAKSARVARSTQVAIATSQRYHRVMSGALKGATDTRYIIRYMVRSGLDEAHHIIPKGGPSISWYTGSARRALRLKMDNLRRKLANLGVDIEHDLDNLVSLDKEWHRNVTLGDDYYQLVIDHFSNFSTVAEYKILTEIFAAALLKTSGKLP